MSKLMKVERYGYRFYLRVTLHEWYVYRSRDGAPICHGGFNAAGAVRVLSGVLWGKLSTDILELRPVAPREGRKGQAAETQAREV
jgi:hypothetical protein